MSKKGMSKKGTLNELITANKEVADELVIANKENADELIIANIGKAKRAAELVIANKELVLAKEKGKHSAELIKLNKKLKMAIKHERIASEKLLFISKAIDYINNAIVISDAHGHHYYQNKALTDMFGYATAEELESLGGGAIVVKNPMVAKEMFDNIISGKSWSGELEMVTKNGHVFPAYERADAIKDSDGNIIGYISVITDFTERKQIQVALEERIKELNGIYSLGLIAEKSEKLEDIYNEFVNVTVPQSMQFPEKVFVSLEIDSKRFCNNETFRMPKTQMYLSAPINVLGEKTGELIVTYTEALPNFDVSETQLVNNYARRISKITERIETKHLLAESEKKQFLNNYSRSLIEASLDPFVTIDVDGKITDVNTATENATGLSRDSLIGTDFSNYFTEPEKAKIGYQKVFAEGNVLDYPLSIRHTSNKIIDVVYNANVYRNEQGKVIGVFAAARDITERNRVREKRTSELIIANKELAFQNEENQKLTDELIFANKELEKFSYSVSHDLRAPLRHINGYVDLLLSRFYDSLPEKGRHYLDNIADSSRQMGTLIDDLLQFSRIGRQEKRLVDLDMNIIVHEVLVSIKQDNPKRNIEWRIATLPQVYGDKALLHLVWTNLLSNAVKFTRAREKTIIEINVLDENDAFIFSIHDNGVGFDMQYAHKLFGVFQRLHPTDEFEGTGIGLANVHHIILRHGGRTWAEAEPDKGATFYFSLPKNKED